MGNTCRKPDRKIHKRDQLESRLSNNNRPHKRKGSEMPPIHPEVVEEPILSDEERIEKLLHDMKAYHLYRLKTELESDPHAFILDNILMCIQFFDSFEKSQASATKSKRNIEREMTESLAKDPLDGMILGDRRVKLLTGMSQVLAQNYIYRGKNTTEDEDEVDLYYGGMGFKDTFMAEGILPLEFTTTWDNLEVYDASEFNQLKDYSHAKGAPPIAKFCMEQPDKKTDFPKGYVRLRCVDEPIAFRRKLETPDLLRPNSEYDEPYSHAFSDGVPEAISESDISAPNSQPTSDDDTIDSKFTERIKNSPFIFPPPRINSTKNLENHNFPSTSKSTSAHQNGFISSRPALPKLQLPQLKIESNEDCPSFIVHAPTPPVRERLYDMQNRPFESSGFLFPHAQPGRYDVTHAQILNNNSKSTPNLANHSRDSPGKETSSGYDTTSTRSRSSSMVSEMMRDKWQKLNLKKLWEFGKKSRKDELPPDGHYDPLPQNCYSEIKYEFSYDDSDQEDDIYGDDDDDSYSESETGYSEDTSLGHGRRNKKKKRNAEEEYEMRFYLNSLQVSSNACSEFHIIGPKINIPPLSMSNGVVLGTTIRCPIPYKYSRDMVEDDDLANSGSYYVTYAFTPSLYSKSWPEGLYFHFNSQVFTYARKNNSQGEMWPSREQMEKIQSFGCNAIPLGYRSVDFFNAEQILEWELKFQDSEVILLDSFKHAHWRAYIFAAILSRAFISPLGPQGIGHEHIRNILYFMCHENFSGWNDEQPGLHLRILLDNLFSCLSRGHMPSFFVRSRNLLQSIPQHNLRFVQGHLNKVRENLIVYSIYAFRNLMDVREKESYALPNFKGLYEILTGEDTELLVIYNSKLRDQNDQEDEEQRERERQKAMKRKKRSHTQRPNLIEQQDKIEKAYFASDRERLSIIPPKHDRTKAELQRRHRRHQKKLQEDKEREMQKLQHNPELRLPEAEKRKSIDLKKTPVIRKNFSPFRLLLTIQFFIKQFLKMAQRATELQCYDQATMYVFQVENLCEIMEEDKYRERLPSFQEDIQEYREETRKLREVIGTDMEQYILVRLASRSQLQPSISLPSLPGSPIMSEFPNLPAFTNNWDLRKLPSSPSTTKELRPSGKKLSRPNIASSLQSLESISPSPNNNPNIPVRSPSMRSVPLSVVDEVILTDSTNRAPRRQESIKFVSPVLHRAATPTRRSPRRSLSRESTFSLSLEHDDATEQDMQSVLMF